MKMAGFSVERMSSYETGDKSLYNFREYLIIWRIQCGVLYDTHGYVYSHRLSCFK